MSLGPATVTPAAVAAPSLASPQGPGSVVTSERRRAADGHAYTWEQFLEYYRSIFYAIEAWDTAPEVRRACDGMTYTMQEFIDEYGPHDGPAFFNDKKAYKLVKFNCDVPLCHHGAPLQAAPLCHHGCRGALQTACTVAAFLPLRADVFYDGDICSALGCPDAVLVTAETINHVQDPNRNGALRVDFVAYDTTGAFTRYHPGASKKQAAAPHTMQQSSRAFSLGIALQRGVGAALHAQVPAAAHGAAAATEHLCTKMDLLEIHPLDAKLISPSVFQAAMEAALSQAGADAVDWSNGGIGQGYPWWVFMAGRMEKFTAMLSEGIVSVSVGHSAGHRPFLSVTTAAQQHAVRISGGGRISIA